jgi:hypothetical protein
MKMVDSSDRVLNLAEIVAIALQNTASEYDVKVAFPAVLSELTQPKTQFKQIGNTLFVVHAGEKGQGFFKSLNADTARNFYENSMKFCVWAKRDLGMSVLVTQFKDKHIEVLFRAIAKKPPMPGMGYQVLNLDSGETRIVLNLGGKEM